MIDFNSYLLTVAELFDDELNKYDPSSVPYELLQIRTLDDKVKYFCQKFKLLSRNVPSESQDQSQIQSTSSAAVSRKRPNISNISQNSSDSDLMEQSSGHSMQQDSSSYSLPPKRRRVIYDPDLIISEIIRDKNSEKTCKTPLKVILTSQHKDSASNNFSQMSSSNLVSGKDLSKFINTADILMNITQQVNEIPPGERFEKASEIAGSVSRNQYLLDTIVNNCVGDLMPSFSSSGESRAYSEEDCEIIPNEEDRELNTPILKESSFKSRYDLRSNRKSSLGASAESKRKNEKAQILSHVILPTSALSQPIELSDSDTEAVTTTSQQYQHQQPQIICQIPQQQAGYIQFDPTTGKLILNRCANPNAFSFQQYQAATSTDEGLVETAAINSNVIEGSQFTVNEGSQLLTMVVPNQNCSTISDDKHAGVIFFNNDVVITEANQTEQTIEIDFAQQTSSSDPIKTQTKQSQNANEEQIENKQIENDKTGRVTAQLKQISSQKVITPKQLIKSNIPSSSRSLSTPRNKNPHVRVLDFNCTPNRFRLSEINENKNDSISNTSRFFNETPRNRSIVSSLPSSAPPKVDSTIQRRQISIEKSIESSTADAFVPIDENTRISGDGETPKVRKSNRRSCVRSISSHKENHPDEERSKRVATTKKKICPDDGDSNASDKKSGTKETIPISNEDAMAEWQRLRNASKNQGLFEQRLREENSKKQASEYSTVRKKRPTRSKKKPTAAAAAATRKKQNDKIVPDDSTKPENTSLNSTIDPDLLNSTELNLEAQLLEENLRSAKKATPAKITVHKSAKKKTPNRKLQIKLMPSPKNRALKRLRSAKNLVSANGKDKIDTNVNSSTSSDKLTELEVAAESSSTTNKQAESDMNNQMPAEPAEKTVDLQNSKAMEASEILIGMPEIIKQQEIERRKSQNQDIQHEQISMSQQPADVATEPIKNIAIEPMPIDKSASVLLQNINQPNLNMSSLLETPFKDYGVAFPRTPNLGNILAQMNTP